GRAVRGVVLVDQRFGVDPDHARDAADVAAGVEVAAAGGEVIMLDATDDRLPDTGPLADLRNGETGLAAALRQGVTDAHAAPPLLLRRCCRPGMRPQWPDESGPGRGTSNQV